MAAGTESIASDEQPLLGRTCTDVINSGVMAGGTSYMFDCCCRVIAMTIQAFEWRSVRYTVGKNTRSRSCMTGLAGNHGGESPNRCTVNSRVARSAGVAGLKIYHTIGMISKSSIMTAGADRIRTQLGTDSSGEVQ